MKKSKKYFVFGEHCIREKAKMQWRHVCLMCLILLMLPFVGKAQQQKVTVRVTKAGVQEVFRQIKEQAGLNFVYDKAQMTAFPPVTLTMEGATVDAVLKRVFRRKPVRVRLRKLLGGGKKAGCPSPKNRWCGYSGCRVGPRRQHHSGGIGRVERFHVGHGLGCRREVHACLAFVGWRGADIHVYRDEDTGNCR